MFFELIAAVFAGFGAAGIAMFLNILTGRRLPKWTTPVAVGVGMIAMTVFNEYNWYPGTSDRLPEGLEVASTVEEQSWIRPWTQLWPYTKRFVAIDTGLARENENLPGQKLVDLYFFQRWNPVVQRAALYNCPTSEMAFLGETFALAEDGSVPDAQWEAVAPDDPLITLVCET